MGAILVPMVAFIFLPCFKVLILNHIRRNYLLNITGSNKMPADTIMLFMTMSTGFDSPFTYLTNNSVFFLPPSLKINV